ncbi:MAG: S24 family peptidase [Alphaproteobacteria bacterium]
MDSQWLKTQFANHPEKTKAGLAAAIGLEPPAISKILNGARQIKAQEYILMRGYFDLPVDGDAAIRKAPAGGGAGPGRKGLDDGQGAPGEWAIPAMVLSSQAAHGPDKTTRIFQVRETAMEPEFRHGEQILVDTSDRKPSPPGIFIVSDGFSSMLRHCEYAPRSSNGEVRISARQKGFQSQVLKPGDFLIIGRVVAKLQMI